MFNEIEEAIIALLADAAHGLPAGGGQLWHVPAARIKRLPPDLKGNLETRLPAVAVSLVDFASGSDTYAGIGEVETGDEGVTEIEVVRFDLVYHLDVWALDLDRGQAILQKAIEILHSRRNDLDLAGSDCRLLAFRGSGGRALPVEVVSTNPVYRRQADYRIEAELLIEAHPTIMREIIIEWTEGEE